MSQLLGTSSQYCEKCRKTMRPEQFYTYKNGTRCELCKACITLHVDNYNPDTFIWLCEKFDVPYLEDEWNTLRDRYYAKAPKNPSTSAVFGKYLAKMKLKQWRSYGYADTDMLREKAEIEKKLHGTSEEKAQEKLEEMKLALEKGEITEAQYKTYADIYAPPPPPPQPGQPNFNGEPQPFEDVKLEDVSAKLTEDDKIYLAMKWGRLYHADEWVALEKLYNEFMESFDIQGAARIDTLKKICKTSLKMDQAIDSGDIETYQRLSRVYDSLMKSAKFTEAQRKEEKSSDFDSIGQIVFFAEKERGKIPRHKSKFPLDKVDEAINDLKQYTKELIANDPSLSQMVENFIKRRESLDSQKADLKQAAEQGLDTVILEDKDYQEFNELIEDKGEKK